MTQSLIVIFSMQERTKVGRRGAKRDFHEKITAVPPKPSKIQTRASKLRQIESERDEGLPVRKARQRK